MTQSFIKSIIKRKLFKRGTILKAIALGSLAYLLYVNSVIFKERIAAFGCFDQCFNFVAAYFMLKGKALYSQIFFNHQPLMAFASYFVQSQFHPETLFHLVYYHRNFMLVFSLLMNLLLIIRFRWAGVGFVFFYEATKYYLFGNSFLPEALVAYCLAYLLGLWWQNKRLMIDYFSAALLTWAVVFLRLPYAPVALLLFGFYLLSFKLKRKGVIFSLSVFIFLGTTVLSSLPLKDYFYQVFTLNQQMVLAEAQKAGSFFTVLFKAFFYPLIIPFWGKDTFFRQILIGLDLAFLVQLIYLWRSRKVKKQLMFFGLILGLSNLRYVEPGTMYYEAFHLLAWYALFLMGIFLTLPAVKNKSIRSISVAILILTGGLAILSPRSYLKEKVNRQDEFTTNYAHYDAYGQVIRTLSSPGDTLFLEQWDDLIYWTAGLEASYPYSLYTPIMNSSSEYRDLRLKMFAENPPDFYYADPGQSQNCSSFLPENLKIEYSQLAFAQNPSCLYLQNTKKEKIENKQWHKIEQIGFHLID